MRTYKSDHWELSSLFCMAKICMKDSGKASYPSVYMRFDRWSVSRPTKLLTNVSFVSLVEWCLEPLFLHGCSLQELYCCADSSEIKVNLLAISSTWWKQTSITRSYVTKMEVRHQHDMLPWIPVRIRILCSEAGKNCLRPTSPPPALKTVTAPGNDEPSWFNSAEAKWQKLRKSSRCW